jgi:hypothetical protein
MPASLRKPKAYTTPIVLRRRTAKTAAWFEVLIPKSAAYRDRKIVGIFAIRLNSTVTIR